MSRNRDRARSWLGTVRKARIPTAQAAGGRAVADLEAQARALAGGTGFGGTTVPPDATRQALADQGMSNANVFATGTPIGQFFPWGSAPWAWNRPTGYNIATRPRATETRASFQTLRALIDAYDVARMCIEHRQDDIRALEWQIVGADGIDDDVTDQVDIAKKLMAKPDGRTPFDSWQSAFLEDVLRYDAGAIYRRRDKAGRVIALEVVDGTTVAPLLDYEGRTPQGDAPAYTQFVAGVPGVWLLDRDLIYSPFRLQTDSPYGLAPIEWMMLNANTDLRFQWYFLQYFTEGSVPEGFMEAPPDSSTPQQLIEFQAAWDAVMEGDQAQKHRIRWVPSGANYRSARGEESFNDAFPLYLLRKTCAAFKVKPTDLGFTDNANRSTSDVQDDVARRVGRKPLLKYLKGIYDSYLQDDCGLPVQFVFDTGEEKEDRLQSAQEWAIWVQNGVVSADEPRKEVLGLPVDEENPVPRFIVTRSGIEPLKSIMAISGDIDPETMAPDGPVEQVVTPEPATADVEPTKVPGPAPADPTAADAVEDPQTDDGKTPVAKSDADLAPGAAMVALFLPADVAADLAVEDGLPAAELHITLAYLGAGLDPDLITAAGRAVGRVAAVWGPVEGRISGHGTFTPQDSPAVAYASFDAPGLGALREAVVDALAGAGVPVAAEHGFTPHITLTYGGSLPAEPATLAADIRELTLTVGPLRLPYRLAGDETGVDQAVVAKELRRWRDQSRKRVQKGLTPRPWMAEAIPPSVTADVWAVLAEARDRGQVDAAFADQSWRG